LGKIRFAIAGVGNCCSSLLQGIQAYRGSNDSVGLIHERVGGYSVSDIEVMAAFDIDGRKVGRDLSEAVFAEPNKAPRVTDLPETGVLVEMGRVLDSVEADSEGLIELSDAEPVDVAAALRRRKADILINIVSGSSIEASKFYARAALEAGCGYVNATPSPVCADPEISKRFSDERLPLVGDDLLDQIGATVVHIGLLEFLNDRGVRIDESYQLDVGGGAESVNTLWKTRELKRGIKTSAVARAVPYEFPLVSGSTDYVDFLGNQRDSFFWFRGRYFGGAPFTMDIRLSTEDAPNAGAVLLDVIRGLKLASDRGLGGPIGALCSYAFKRPPERLGLVEAYRLFKEYAEA
jgi:myo-inositol-1-phosphate synthase